MPEEFIGLAAVIGVFGIPIVAILVAHQRKMAEIIHGNHAQARVVEPLLAEVHALRREVSHLRDTVNAAMIASDPAGSILPPPMPDQGHTTTSA